MKKSLLFIAVGLCVLFLQSCRNNLGTSMPASRNYQQDVEVLNEFVDIKKTTHEYYINPNKRSSALSYITNADVEELNAVNQLNLNTFEQSLNQINKLTKGFAASHSVDYIVMMTADKIYTSLMNASSPVTLRDNSWEIFEYASTVTSLQVANLEEERRASGAHLGMEIDLRPEAYGNAGWAFLLTCELGYNHKEKVQILFCGIGYYMNPCFELATVHSANADWTFSITNLNADNHIADLKILRL